MKRTLTLGLALLLTAFAFTVGIANAQKGEENRPKVKDYNDALKGTGDLHKNVNNPDYYKDFDLENTKTKKTAKLKDLSDFEKDIFYMVQAEKLTKQLAGLNYAWNKEKDVAPERAKDAKKEDLAKDDRLPDKTDIEEALAKLVQLRKDHAVKYEKIVEDTLKKHAKVIPEKDAKLYSQQVREFHDRQKLIERKKDSK